MRSLALLLPPLLLVGCPSKSPAPAVTPALPTAAPGPVAAHVNGRPILIAELTRQAGSPGYGETRAVRLRKQLDVLIDQELYAELAEGRGLATHPDVVQAGKDQSVARLQAELMKQVEAQPVDDEQLRSRYEARYEDFYRPEQVEVATAVLPTREAALAFVRAARRRISGNRFDYRDIFARTARAHGATATLPAWVIRLDDGGRLPKPHSDAVFALPDVGALSMPHLADGGYVVFQRTGRRDRKLIPFEQARLRLVNGVRKERRAAALDAVVAKASARLKVQTFEDLLDKVVMNVQAPTAKKGSQGQRMSQDAVMRRAPTSPNTIRSSRSSTPGTTSGASAKPAKPRTQAPPGP